MKTSRYLVWAVLLVLASAHADAQAPGSGITITALDKTSARPFSLLVIDGSGFDPDTAEIAVLILGIASGGSVNIVPTAVPVHSATRTRLEVVVPPLIDARTTALTSGRVAIQVVQTTATSLMTSNVVTTLTVTEVTPARSTLAPGAVTRAYLQAGLNVLSEVRRAANPEVAPLLEALTGDITALAGSVGRIVGNRNLLVTLPTTDGNPFILDAATLELTDRLIAAYLEQVVPLLERAMPTARYAAVSPFAVTPCPAAVGDRFIDDFICGKQRLDQERAVKAVEAWQYGARLEMGFYLGFMGNWIATSLAQATLITSATANALQLVWTATSSYVTNYLTLAPPPPLSKPLMSVGARLLDRLVFSGVPVISSTLKGYQAYEGAAKIASRTNPSPDKGLIVSSSSSRDPGASPLATVLKTAPAGSSGCDPSSSLCVQPYTVTVPATQGTASLTSVAQPAPVVSQFDGTYTGTYSGTFTDPSGSTRASGNVAVRIANGALTVTQPGPGEGTVAPDGRILAGSVRLEFGRCTFGGSISITPQSRTALAGGAFSCEFGPGVSAQGLWSATR